WSDDGDADGGPPTRAPSNRRIALTAASAPTAAKVSPASQRPRFGEATGGGAEPGPGTCACSTAGVGAKLSVFANAAGSCLGPLCIDGDPGATSALTTSAIDENRASRSFASARITTASTCAGTAGLRAPGGGGFLDSTS